ncbi:MAG: putative metal-binding motif-containing protein, partial [Nitrospiraceae bacterium]
MARFLLQLIFCFTLLLSVALFTASVFPQTCTDGDGDGFAIEGGVCGLADCNDGDDTIYPGAPKLCDGKDNNCDNKKDFTTDEDKDNDGVPWCAGDCDDNNENRAPNILEAPMGSPVCLDGIDNDCDNKADSIDPGCQFTCFDSDGDGYGVNGDATCTFPGENDCNDNDATVHPGQTDDSCNGIDNNCSGLEDDQYVMDNACGTGQCQINNIPSSCVNGVETACQPGSPSPEGVAGSPSCSDGVDNDCDGMTDTDPACLTSCQDFDGDGYGVTQDMSCQFAGLDCDDSNPAINPAGDDANCNGIDEDCTGGADSRYLVDTSCGTGLCNTTNTPSSCTGGVETLCQPGTPVAEDTPGVGVCIDGVDNDCDGMTDAADSEGCSSLDVDDDGDTFTENQGDCDDGDATIYPGAPKLCDAKDNNCDGKKDFTTDEDKDNDGVPWCAADCDDNDPDRAPTFFEGGFGSAVCTDTIDNDCDNLVDFADPPCQGDCIDTDGDGYGVNGDVSCDVPGQVDCDDSNPTVNPAGNDANCNGLDEDCAGGADSGYIVDASCGVGECQTNNIPSSCTGGVETACQPGAPILEGPLGDPTCSEGLDEDCDGLADTNDPGCLTNCIDQDGDGYGVNGGTDCTVPGVSDCNDTDATVNPGQIDDSCNGIDNNCSGTADDEYVIDSTCGTGECLTNNTPSSCTGGVETICQPGLPVPEDTPFVGVCIDGLDNDCDGLTDQEPGIEDPDCSNDTEDNDGDGYCRAAACADGSSPNDCDDTDPNVYPGAPKVCDGKDSNCDGKKDFSTDEDKDEDGVPLCAGDCNDNNAGESPNLTEGPFGDATCSDGLDNDCQNGSDASDPACAAPSCETKANPKDGPHVETMMAPGPDGQPDTGDDIVHPENSTLLCGKCHGASLQDPIRSDCDRCHSPGGSSKALYPDPWPFGFGSAPDVQVHSSSVVGTKYGAWDMDCVTCHNPHLQEQNAAYGTSYGKLVKEYVCFDNPVTGLNIEEIIKFTAASGPGSFADGPPHNENICEMCHTQTLYHRNDGSAVAHNDNTDCAECHLHSEGFKPSCGSCHSVPPPTGSHLKHYGGLPDLASYGDTGITRDYVSQGTEYIMNCGNCHPLDSANHQNNILNAGGGDAEIELYNPDAPAGSLKALNPSNASYNPGSTIYADADGMNYTEGTCDNVYCHSVTDFSTSAAVPEPTPYVFPKEYDPPWQSFVVTSTSYQTTLPWGTASDTDGIMCNNCHGYPILTEFPT